MLVNQYADYFGRRAESISEIIDSEDFQQMLTGINSQPIDDWLGCLAYQNDKLR